MAMPNPSSNEWRVWLHLPTGRAAFYFPDEDAATVFAVRNGSVVERAPINH
jgi:hypothetical protein